MLQTSGSQASAESWKKAKVIAEKLGYIPHSFSIAVRTLISDQRKNGSELKPVTKYQVARLLKTPSFKAMLYHAAKGLRSEKFEDREKLTVGDLMDMFEPFDLAAMIGGFLFFRKAKKLLANEGWDLVSEELLKDSQIGAQVGCAIPKLGVGAGLIIGLIRHIALATLTSVDLKAMRAYQLLLKKTDREYDLEKEIELFGCCSVQVGVFVLSRIGYGRDVGTAYSIAFDDEMSFNSLSDEFQVRLKFTKLWIDGLKNGAEQPVQQIPGEFYPLAVAKEEMMEAVEDIKAGRKNWLDCSKEDISPEKTPELFSSDDASSEIPEQLSEVFSMEEITAMEENDFDNLIDTIDEEGASESGEGSENELDELEEMVN